MLLWVYSHSQTDHTQQIIWGLIDKLKLGHIRSTGHLLKLAGRTGSVSIFILYLSV